MTTKAKYRSWRYMGLSAGLAVLACVGVPSDANANSNICFLSSPFPVSPVDPWPSHPKIAGNPYFGSSRGGNSRSHAGLDFHMPMNTHVPIQAGATSSGGEAQNCNIQGNEKSPLRNVSGYGLTLYFDCGNGIKVMYAHLNGYNAGTKTAINGDTGNARGTAPHVHYEVSIDGQKVDPMCVLGLTPPSSFQPNARNAGPCPASLPAGPANLCDSNIRNLLKQDGQKKGGGIAKDPGGTTYKPSDHDTGVYGNPDPQYDVPYSGGTGPDFEGEGDWGNETIEGTTLFSGNNDEDVGEAGGTTHSGTSGGEAPIPPLTDSEGENNSSCAVDTWVALANRSALEARRETMMNRRFIAKADSVIDYGCLSFYLKKTESDLAGIFSETDRWANMEVDLIGAKHTIKKTLGTQSMDSALMNVVWAAHEKYKGNFNHAMMGELEGYAEKAAPDNCQDMQKVWSAAQCQNIPAADKIFLNFKDLISKDTREFPKAMACNKSGVTQLMIDAATGKATQYDKPEPRFDHILPPKDGNDCKAAIPTGVTIYTVKSRDKESNEFAVEKLILNAKNRGLGFVTMDELKKAYPVPWDTLSDNQKNETLDKIKDAGINIHDGDGIPGMPRLGSQDPATSEIKTYEDGVCSNIGCTYAKPEKGGLGKCVKL